MQLQSLPIRHSRKASCFPEGGTQYQPDWLEMERPTSYNPVTELV